MDKLMTDLIAQSPTIGVLIFLVWRLDARLQELQEVLIDLVMGQRQPPS